MSKEVLGNEHNVIAYGTKITGDVTAETDFRLDGMIEGTIDCKGKVIIGTKGVLVGTLTCANADVLGSIKGTIHIENTLSLKSSAKVEGDIDTAVLSIEPQATFTGSCDMTKAANKPASK